MTWESYLISVSVVNNIGVGPASKIVKVRTLEGIPSRAPIIIQCEPISSTQLRSNGKVHLHRISMEFLIHFK